MTIDLRTIPVGSTKPERLPFDPMQPLFLSDGTPVRIVECDGTSTPWLVAWKEPDSYGCGAGCTGWFYRDGTREFYPYLRLTNEPGPSLAARHAIAEWRNRHESEKPDFLDADWFQPYANVHLPLLVERDEIAMVSFFENERKLEANRRTEMRVGRYVRRFCGGKLKDEDVERVAAASDVKVLGNRVKITQDACEIEQVYVNGPRSCMSGGAYEYDTGGTHPARVYAGPDLALAYIGDPEDASSRCVVWPDRMIHGRIYGDLSRMKQMLAQLGYESGSLHGARVRLIECDYGIVMPYVDGVHGAALDRKNGVCILGTGRDVDTSNTNGLGTDDSCVECERCESLVNEDEACGVETGRHNIETWCDSCVDCYTVYCEDYGATVWDDRAVEVHDADGNTSYMPDWDLWDYVEVTAGDRAGEYWHVDATVTAGDGEVYHVDDAPAANNDDAAKPTAAEPEAAGQGVLPLEQPSEAQFRVYLEYAERGIDWIEPADARIPQPDLAIAAR